MYVQQFVMAYGVEQDRLRALLPQGGEPLRQQGENVLFHPPFLRLRFTGVGIQGGCPAEQDNGGCLFPGGTPELRLPEPVTARKEFCDCAFAWNFGIPGAHGQSLGKTLPAIPTEPRGRYPRQALTAENAAIPCDQVLGAYRVTFQR